MELIHQDLSQEIIKVFYKVYNELGYGFMEKIYQNAMEYELNKQGFACESEKLISVYYENIIVGDYRADLIVENKIIVELKATSILHDAHEAQLINYLRCTDIEIGLLMNFGEQPKFKRKAYSNSRKKQFNK